MYLLVDRMNKTCVITETFQAAFDYKTDHPDVQIVEITLSDVKRYFGEIPAVKEFLARKKRQARRFAQGHKVGRPKKQRPISE